MKRNKFSLSHTRLLSCDMGELVPCGLVEVLPGDTLQHGISALVRAAPMLAPVMHPVHVRLHCWFVPHRLVWDEWEDFITGGPAGTSVPAFPTKSLFSGFIASGVGSLTDYLGVPTGTATVGALDRLVSALPYRVYATIWNEWYRDQDLQTEIVVSKASGADITTGFTLQRCSWEKDYFTAARPWEQKGPSTAVPLPVVFSETGATPGVRTLNRSGPLANDDVQVTEAGTGLAPIVGNTSMSIMLLREAMALQRFEEARARYGSRYVEYLRYLGVRSSDARLSRPEYLGGASQTIQFSEVLQTAPGGAGPGDMFGHGIAGVRSPRYRRFFEEHGYVMCLLSARPKPIYTNGLERTWNRRTKEDFYQRELEHIGQQEVLNKETYMPGGSFDGIFGYNDRYSEYRSQMSFVSGEFRTSTLNFWHFARAFSGAQALNAAFIDCTPSELPFAVPSEDVLYVMVKHSIQARRLVSGSTRSFAF